MLRHVRAELHALDARLAHMAWRDYVVFFSALLVAGWVFGNVLVRTAVQMGSAPRVTLFA